MLPRFRIVVCNNDSSGVHFYQDRSSPPHKNPSQVAHRQGPSCQSYVFAGPLINVLFLLWILLWTTLLNSKAARSGTVQSSRGSGELEGTDPHVHILGIAVTAAGADWGRMASAS